MFHFKLGGCPAPMDKLCDPTEQPKYPIPNYKQQTPSLQSPTEAIQTFLYNFDERRGMLTKKLQKESKKTMELKKILSKLQETQWTSQHPTKDHRARTKRHRKKRKRRPPSSSSNSDTSNSSSESEYST